MALMEHRGLGGHSQVHPSSLLLSLAFQDPLPKASPLQGEALHQKGEVLVADLGVSPGSASPQPCGQLQAGPDQPAVLSTEVVLSTSKVIMFTEVT